MSFEENFVAILSLVEFGSVGFAKITTMMNILELSENIQNLYIQGLQETELLTWL